MMKERCSVADKTKHAVMSSMTSGDRLLHLRSDSYDAERAITDVKVKVTLDTCYSAAYMH